MTDPLRDHIRAALDYDVTIRDALATVPNSLINDLVERLAEGMAAPKPKRDPLTDPRPGDMVRFRDSQHFDQHFSVAEVSEVTPEMVYVSYVGTDEGSSMTRAYWSDWSGFDVQVLHTAPDEVTT